MSKQRVWISGEGGNLAMNIHQLLLQSTKLQPAKSTWRFTDQVAQHHNRLEVDILGQKLEAAIEQSEADIVVHSAAVVNTDKCQADPTRAIEVNLLGTQYILNICRQLKKKLVYFSTTATYDPDPACQRPYTEASRQRPPTLYGITKYAGELLVTGQSEVPWIVVRPCFIYGDPPLDFSSQLCRVAVHSALKQLRPNLAGTIPRVTLDPAALKDYMRVEDFAAAVIKLLEGEFWGEILNVSAQQARPMREYFTMLENELEFPIHMLWVPEADYMGDHLVSSTRLRGLAGWQPRMSVPEGISLLAHRTLQYVENLPQEVLYK